MNIPASRLPEFLGIPVTQPKNLLLIMISLIIISSYPTNSQSFSSSPTDPFSGSSDSDSNFQPSLAVVIGVLAIMFALTFLLLVYAKCCHRPSSLHYSNQENFGELPRPLSRVSGIDKTVIQSLPFFRFSTLKGWRNGLECSICLSKFEDIEILRMLPKCKHAFHIDCVDQWLEKHAGCPLCRCKVSEEDVKLLANSSSLRFLSSDRTQEGSNLELFIEREGSTRFGSQRSYGKKEHEMNDEQILEDQEILHKFNHRIIISDYNYDLMMKNRWSNLNSSDLLFLKSEMITSLSCNFLDHDQEPIACMSRNKFDSNPATKTAGYDQNDDHDHQVIKIKEEIKRKREFERKIKKLPNGELDIESKDLKSAKLVEQRSMSEIIVHPRFLGVESSNKEDNLGEINAQEERLKRIWLPIARRTVRWFANRDEQLQVNTKSQV
ncbi:hypothetical protein L1887_03303 [Cichorium endivia]|nr:hypothetical protein L1887_03303 [Cichorium endivia]